MLQIMITIKADIITIESGFIFSPISPGNRSKGIKASIVVNTAAITGHAT